MLVSQTGYPTGCQQACVAMLAKVNLEEVIHIVGPQALGFDELKKACDHYKVELGSKWIMDYYGGYSLGGLVRKNKTFILSQCEAGNIHYSHAVLLHKGQLYDPYHGIDPTFTWRRWFYAAQEIVDAPLFY
jgi:hypothetical protein